MFLKFARRTDHPHPHLEAAINNYTALLIQMGHSQDEVLARLKRLAPEISNRSRRSPRGADPASSGLESTDNQPKEE